MIALRAPALSLKRFLCGASVALAVAAGAQAHAEAETRIIARSGRAAPGLPQGLVFALLRSAVINARGDVAFLGSVDGRTGDTEKDDLVWVALRGRPPRAVLREGTRLRRFAEARVGYLDDGPLLGPKGAILHFPRIVGSPDTINGLLHGRRGRRLRPILDPGSAAPQLPTLVGSGPFAIGSEDQVVFVVRKRPSPTSPVEETLFAWDGRGEPERIVATGQPAPDPTDGTVEAFRWSVPNASGLPALRVDGKTLQFLLVPDAAGHYIEHARTGSPPPGGPEGTLLDEIGVPWLNTAGDLAFIGEVDIELGGPVDYGTHQVIWVLRSDGHAQPLVRTGDPAPGAPPGSVFVSVDLVEFSNSGRALIRGRLGGDQVPETGNLGYWLHDPVEGLRLVFRGGGILPCGGDLPAWPTSDFDAALSADGTVVLVVGIPEGDLGREGLVAFPPSGGCTLIAKEGEPFLLGRSTRMVTGIDFSGSLWQAQSGTRALNDSGELVFAVQFEDGDSAVLARRLGP